MAFKVLMPRLSDTMEEGKIIKWEKKEGDRVEKGDVLAEVETDKANLEMEAYSSGILRKIILKEGVSAPVGDLIAIIGEKDEDISDIVKEGKEKPAKEEEKKEEPKEKEPEKAEAAPKPTEEEKKEEKEEMKEKEKKEEPKKEERKRIFISPLAKKIAEEGGLDISTIEGSGPEGRIIKKDVLSTISKAKEIKPEIKEKIEEYREEPLSTIRKTIAKRLTLSKGPVPHFYVTAEIDMERAIYFRNSLKTLKKEIPVSFNDILIKASAIALEKFPQINASYRTDKIIYYNVIHIGIAVALEDGLITPVIRNVEKKTLFEVAKESKELIEKAKEKKLKPEEYTGATFTISNMGMYDVENFSAIINPPEGAILAVGSIIKRPVVIEDKIEIRNRMKVTISCDHRIVDGVVAAQFLQELKIDLEKPIGIVL
ncbi:MAG TPA: pyruvate dehydrogenase complex dihydrolipoamide acetyltransferase [Nitrospinota bacterium]|nr:pyruvate dehydrogenase complex dihydrolipoamide acetyltransferase [Nitrospinota bacterium]